MADSLNNFGDSVAYFKGILIFLSYCLSLDKWVTNSLCPV
ncbi:hypothetical protein [uncultured Gammaproteobacteria bacterium]|nr:hypothetical protein [uncultured Gammaproteobacteria bacterium]CAC9457779.1 hypothetical protein [uncultured Gammaproteobacteria bacterium]